MDLRILASGLLVSLALAGCRTVPEEGDYNFAEHPGKALVVLSTRMTAGEPCPHLTVTGQLGFRKAEKPGSSAVTFDMHVPRPARKVSSFSDMAGEEEVMVAADPPTHFVVQEVSAGRYELNSLVVVVTSPRTTYRASSWRTLSFTAKEGEVVYLGELEVRMRGGDCKRLDPGISGGAAFSVRDAWEEHQGPFQAKIRNISPAMVQKRLLRIH